MGTKGGHVPFYPKEEESCSSMLEGARVKWNTTKENHIQCLCQDHQSAEANIGTKVGDLSLVPAYCPLLQVLCSSSVLPVGLYETGWSLRVQAK